MKRRNTYQFQGGSETEYHEVESAYTSLDLVKKFRSFLCNFTAFEDSNVFGDNAISQTNIEIRPLKEEILGRFLQNGNVKYSFEVGQSFPNDRWAGDQKQRLRVCVCLIVSRLLTSSGLSKQEDINIENLLLDVVLVYLGC